MIDQNNITNSSQNNSDKNLNNLGNLSQKNQDLIAKELDISSHKEEFERIENFSRDIQEKIKKYHDMPEKLKSFLKHELRWLVRGEDEKAVIESLSNEDRDFIFKYTKRNQEVLEPLVKEYCQLFDGEEIELHPTNLQTSLDGIKEKVYNDKRCTEYFSRADIKINIDVHKKIKFCIGAANGIFRNLMKNAVKAIAEQQETIKKNNQSSDINISIEKNKIYFHNYGVIPKKLQNRTIFKLGTTTTGTWIWLYLAKKWIKKLWWSIDFISNEQEGTTFIVTLPEELMIKE